jgi:hypothetical protein
LPPCSPRSSSATATTTKAPLESSTPAWPVLAAAYLLSKRNLWVCILAHGFIDTFGVVGLYFGWLS